MSSIRLARYEWFLHGGAWAAQLVKPQPLDLSSGCKFKPRFRPYARHETHLKKKKEVGGWFFMFHELYKNTTGLRVHRDNVLTAKPKTFGVWPFPESLGLPFCKEKITHPGTRPFLILPLYFSTSSPTFPLVLTAPQLQTRPQSPRSAGCPRAGLLPCPGTSAPDARELICHTSLVAPCTP